MDECKTNNNYQSLTNNYRSEMHNLVPEKLKCIYCRNILMNACQTKCGCRFCRNCIDEMLLSGSQFCPGNTDNCINELLIDVVSDYRVNRKISKLYREEFFVKSAKKNLFHSSDFINKRISNESINTFCPFDNNKYNRTVIEQIDKLKTEIIQLKHVEKTNRNEIEKIKEKLDLKDEKLEMMDKEIKLLKNEKEILENYVKNIDEIKIKDIETSVEKKFQILTDKKAEIEEYWNQKMQISVRNIWYKLDEMDLEMNKRIKYDEINSINNEIKFLQITIDDLKKKIDISIDDLKVKMNDFVTKKTLETISQKKIEPKIERLESFVNNKRNGIFEWKIDFINQRRHQRSWINSEYFFVKMYPYKLQLRLFANGINDFKNIGLTIDFIIVDDLINRFLRWPFKANITMTIVSEKDSNVQLTSKKYCQINLKEKTEWELGESFGYLYSDLSKAELLKENGFIIMCCVDLNYF